MGSQMMKEAADDLDRQIGRLRNATLAGDWDLARANLLTVENMIDRCEEIEMAMAEAWHG